jgi:hypothetical protein
MVAWHLTRSTGHANGSAIVYAGEPGRLTLEVELRSENNEGPIAVHFSIGVITTTLQLNLVVEGD